MSRFPIIDRQHVRLSRDPQDEGDYHQRVVLGCRVLSPDGPFWLFTTHYSLSPVARERNAVETYDFVCATAGQDPFTVTGDFNAHPDRAPIQFLTGAAPLQGRRGDWVDAWAALHPVEAGYTSNPWKPWERIDYVFVPRRAMLLSIEIAADKPDAEGLYPSDHLGLLARLQA
jgi:endonuclease/exonuclease/phosphatase family metal-dependent hydrolase